MKNAIKIDSRLHLPKMIVAFKAQCHSTSDLSNCLWIVTQLCLIFGILIAQLLFHVNIEVSIPRNSMIFFLLKLCFQQTYKKPNTKSVKVSRGRRPPLTCWYQMLIFIIKRIQLNHLTIWNIFSVFYRFSKPFSF